MLGENWRKIEGRSKSPLSREEREKVGHPLIFFRAFIGRWAFCSRLFCLPKTRAKILSTFFSWRCRLKACSIWRRGTLLVISLSARTSSWKFEVFFPGAHGVGLHQAIGVFAADAVLDQVEQKLSAEDEAARAFKIRAHALGIDEHRVDQVGGLVQQIVGERGRVGQDDALGVTSARCRARARGRRFRIPPAHCRGPRGPGR